MLQDIAISIISSVIYDCMKMGKNYLKREQFDKSVQSEKGIENVSADEINQLYKISNQLLTELQSQHTNSFTKEEFLSIVRNYLPSVNKEFEQKVYSIALQKADDCYDDSNYDKALNFYDEAELYQNSQEEYSYILWKKFMCHLQIENYYKYIVEYRGHYYDLQKIYNNCDYNISKTVSTISTHLQVSKLEANQLLNCMLHGNENTITKRKYAIKQSQFNIGLRALRMTINNDLEHRRQSVLDNCIVFN